MRGLIVLTLATCVSAIVGLLAGATWFAPATLLAAFSQHHSDAATILWQLRLPRIIVVAVAGGSLGVGGALLQGLLRNPLVDPYLTGTSAGAACAIAIGVVLGIAAPALPAIGFLAGLGTAAVVALLARRGSGIDANRLIVAGVSVSALLSAVITVVLLHASDMDSTQAILSWLAGSPAGRGWPEIRAAVPYAAVGFVLAVAMSRPLDALRLGDQRARSLGVNVGVAQWFILAATSLLAAAAVSLCGMLGFVGLIVPHIARRAVGSGAFALIPASALLGASMSILADAIGRTIIAPSEVPLGVILAFFGVPAFLYLIARTHRSQA